MREFVRGEKGPEFRALGRPTAHLACVYLAVLVVGGCAHAGPPTVERRFGDTILRGPAYTSAAYRAVMELLMAETIAAHEGELGSPSSRVDPHFVVAITDPDPYALYVAIDASPGDGQLLEYARRRQTTLADCELGMAIAARGERAIQELTALAPRCPRATTLAIRYALASHDESSLPALARLAAPSSDFVLYDAAFQAFLHLGDASGVEQLVAAHVADPSFVARARERARATDVVAMRAAILAPLAPDLAYAREAISALVSADRRADARRALERLSPTTLDDRLALAELALAVGDSGRALAWLETAYSDGASTRALAMRADALEAAGRSAEATRLRATLIAGTAGALAREAD